MRMRKHPTRRKKAPAKKVRPTKSRTAQRSSKPKRPPKSLPQPVQQDGGGFLTLLLKRINWASLNGLQQRKHAAGRPAHTLSRGQLLAAILFHYTVTWAGTLGEHLFWLLGITVSESTLSERRQALPFVVFEELLKRVLRPLAKPSAEAFFRGLRLIAIDGVRYSMPNTAQVNAQCPKVRNCTGGRNPFPKLQCAVLVELLMHNPLAACLGWKGESEWKVAQGLLEHLPAKSLLLTDRLYGCGAFLLPAWAKLQSLGSHFLARVKLGLSIQREIKRLSDGSRIVEIQAVDPENKRRVTGTMQVREIKATIKRKGYRTVQLRLWTSLLDEQLYPAEELVRLYAARWEQELYFRELKSELKLNNLLQSQTPETAAQEVAAIIIGSSLIAEERSKLKPGEELSHRISFLKVWETLEPLWLTLLVGADILTETQKQQLCERFYALAATRFMPNKRIRACPRVLRQPHQAWPKKRNQKSSTEPLHVSIVSRK
jgi:Transposase DDE domain